MVALKKVIPLALALCTTSEALTLLLRRWQTNACKQVVIGDTSNQEVADNGKCVSWEDKRPFGALEFEFKYFWQQDLESRYCELQVFEGEECTGRHLGALEDVNRSKNSRMCGHFERRVEDIGHERQGKSVKIVCRENK